MNWLGHLWLTPHTPQGWLGALLGDFARGPLDNTWPREVHTAVRLHRAIDALCARHPAFRQSRTRIDARHGHYRAVLVDVFWDHVLASGWEQFATEPLEQFVTRVHDGLDSLRDDLRGDLAHVYPRLRGWLLSYRHLDGIDATLRRMRARLRRDHPLEDALPDLAAQRDGFAADFALFHADAQVLAREFA